MALDETAPGPQPTFLGHITADHQYVDRFLLSFKDVATPGRTVPISSFNTWMGTIRERSVHPIAARIRELFVTGSEVAAITRSSSVHLHGPARYGEVLEVRCRAFQSPDGGTCDGEFQWFVLREDMPPVLVATSCLATAFARLKAFGVAQTAPAPPFWRDFFQDHSCGAPREALAPPPGEGPYSGAPRAAPRFHREILQAKPLLLERTFETSQQDANLVGNIYFAHYTLWQERTAEGFFFGLAPHLFRDPSERRELVCVRNEVRHIREAMPFDAIRVRMYLLALEEHRASFYFEFFRIGGQGTLTKLTAGVREYVFLTWPSPGTPAFLPLPGELREALLPLLEACV